jgi:hypothetical protein
MTERPHGLVHTKYERGTTFLPGSQRQHSDSIALDNALDRLSLDCRSKAGTGMVVRDDEFLILV